MNKNSGFMLIEVLLAVVIVSICLTFIVQSLLTNFRTGMRFQETVRSLFVMENQLSVLLAGKAPETWVDATAPLDKPYEKYSIGTKTKTINDHLKNFDLKLVWNEGQRQRHLDITTFIYNPNEKPQQN